MNLNSLNPIGLYIIYGFLVLAINLFQIKTIAVIVPIEFNSIFTLSAFVSSTISVFFILLLKVLGYIYLPKAFDIAVNSQYKRGVNEFILFLIFTEIFRIPLIYYSLNNELNVLNYETLDQELKKLDYFQNILILKVISIIFATSLLFRNLINQNISRNKCIQFCAIFMISIILINFL